MRLVIWAVALVLVGCSSERSSIATPNGVESAVQTTEAAPLFAFCRTATGRFVAVGEANSAGVSPVTIVSDGNIEASQLSFSEVEDGISLSSDIRLTREPVAREDGGWTPNITAVATDAFSEACLWRPRTRLIALSETSLVEAYRNAEGVLILEVRSVTDALRPSLEIVGGREEVGAREEIGDSVTLVFDQGQDRYIVYAPKGEAVTLSHWRDGARLTTDALPMQIIGDDPDAAGSPIR